MVQSLDSAAKEGEYRNVTATNIKHQNRVAIILGQEENPLMSDLLALSIGKQG
jgi:hypothetical protein